MTNLPPSARTRPLDRLPSIRAKLGSVIVFAVAVTIVIMYAAMGFALRAYERDRQYNQLVEATKLAASTGFDSRGRPTSQMLEAVAKAPRFVAVVNVAGERVLGDLDVPDSVNRVLAGREDSGSEGDVQAVAGLALLGSLGSALGAALAVDDVRIPAVMTFVTTASGMAFLGIAAAFWGLLAGMALLGLDRLRAAPPHRSPP